MNDGIEEKLHNYRVIWHDCEDDRTGTSFTVQGKDLCDAYFKAVDTIKGYSDYLRDHFCGIYIECLVDENDMMYWPDFFLKNRGE